MANQFSYNKNQHKHIHHNIWMYNPVAHPGFAWEMRIWTFTSTHRGENLYLAKCACSIYNFFYRNAPFLVILPQGLNLKSLSALSIKSIQRFFRFGQIWHGPLHLPDTAALTCPVTAFFKQKVWVASLSKCSCPRYTSQSPKHLGISGFKVVFIWLEESHAQMLLFLNRPMASDLVKSMSIYCTKPITSKPNWLIQILMHSRWELHAVFTILLKLSPGLYSFYFLG